MTDNERARYLTAKGVKTSVVADAQKDPNLSFEKIATAMISVAAGLQDPATIPKIETKV